MHGVDVASPTLALIGRSVQGKAAIATRERRVLEAGENPWLVSRVDGVQEGTGLVIEALASRAPDLLVGQDQDMS
jgi:hypothetical protein